MQVGGTRGLKEIVYYTIWNFLNTYIATHMEIILAHANDVDKDLWK